MRKVLDKLFADKKISIVVPVVIALIMYALFLLFGDIPSKAGLLIVTPIASVMSYLGFFCVLYLQVKNPFCSDKIMDFFELATLVFFTPISVFFCLYFLFHIVTAFNPIVCIGPLIWSVVAFVDSKRKGSTTNSNDT